MSGPPRSIAQVRSAVRAELADIAPGSTVLVACSGGADSLALLAGAVFTGSRLGLRIGLVSVDHGLQSGSRQRADDLATWARGHGMDPAEAVTVAVGTTGGPEAAARDARYAALAAAADRHGAAAVLLGHTRDDQAETVLLALARGSGARALGGMPARRGRYRRPLLAVPRSVARDAARLDPYLGGREPWEDPHNADPAFARARVRAALRTLTDELGPGLVGNLSRTADLLRADADHLDALGVAAAAGLGRGDAAIDTAGVDTIALAGLPGAVRARVLRLALLDAGVPGAALTSAHVAAVDALICRWHGQGAVSLPHGVRAERQHGRLKLRRGDAAAAGERGSACTTARSTAS